MPPELILVPPIASGSASYTGEVSRIPSGLDSDYRLALRANPALMSAHNVSRQRSRAVMKAVRDGLTIIATFLEDGIPLSAVDSPGLRALLVRDKEKSPCNEMPSSKSLYLLITDLYAQYHQYFENYFESDPHQSVSLTFHKWQRSLHLLPSIFVKAHYINNTFSSCDLIIGVVENGDIGLAGLLSDCPMIPNLGSRINQVTCNFELGPKTALLLQHITGDPSFLSSRILPCIPTRLCTILEACFSDVMLLLKIPSDVGPVKLQLTLLAQDTSDIIPLLIINFLGPVYTSFLLINFEKLTPQTCPSNPNMDPSHSPDACYELLRSAFSRSANAKAFDFLSAVLYFQDQIRDLAQDQGISVSEFDWTVATFAYCISYTVQHIIISASSMSRPCHPNVHMLLKWVKVCIARTRQVASTFSDQFQVSIEGPLTTLLSELQDLHSLLELRQSLVIASYLHPGTKKYLCPADLERVKRCVGDCGDIPASRKGKTPIKPSLDDEILRMFNCSGASKSECNLYETRAPKEIEYDSAKPYLTAEAGSHLLQFWRVHHRKYATLASLARTHLSIQVNSYLPFKSAKTLDVSGFANDECSLVYGLRPLYFIHSLSQDYHIRRFDPLVPGASIEDTARYKSTARPESGETSFCESSSVYPEGEERS